MLRYCKLNRKLSTEQKTKTFFIVCVTQIIDILVMQMCIIFMGISNQNSPSEAREGNGQKTHTYMCVSTVATYLNMNSFY